MTKENQKTWSYTEKHNKILAAICELMDPEEYDEEVNESMAPAQDSEFDRSYHKTKRKIRNLTVFPTSKAIAKKTGFSKAVVEKHLKEINLANFKGTAKSLTPAVVTSLARTAISTGRAAESKLFMQIVEDWEEKSQVKGEHTGDLKVSIVRKIRKPK